MIAPEPSIDPALAMSSNVYGRSRCSSSRIGAEEPPGNQHFTVRPSGGPPASPAAAKEDQVEGVVGAGDAPAEVAALVRLRRRAVEHVGLVLVLAANEDEALVGAGRDRGDHAALDQQVGVALHQQPVLERPGL